MAIDKWVNVICIGCNGRLRISEVGGMGCNRLDQPEVANGTEDPI